MVESWLNDGIRGIFATIDRAVFSLISVVYEIMIQISQVIIFNDDTLKEFSSKVYSLLGIFMMFKISFSFISYLVNPDQINDKAKGAHKIILNVIIVLVLIIITPTAFTKLYQAQNAILEDNIIPRFFLQTEGDIGGNRSYVMADECGDDQISYTETDGDYIAMLIFRPFYQIEKGRTPGPNDFENYCKVGNVGETDYATPGAYLTNKILNAAPNGMKDMYVVDYKFFVSTIVGIVILLILVSFCFDIAVRSIKLGFLQLVAPIPIISYVDPKSGKDGTFSKWLKEVGKTWASLFVRLIAIFFAVYVIKLVIVQENLKTLNGQAIQYKFWVDLFLIIGALMFAKKLPKLLEDILGIKFDGGLTLNPMKKIRDQALGGKAITGGLKAGVAGAAGLGLGVAANTAALATNIKKDGLKKALMGESKGVKGGFRAIGTIAGLGVGGISSAFHGGVGAFKNDSLKKGIMPGLKKSVDNRDLRDKRGDAGYGLGTRMTDALKGAAGIKTTAKNKSIEIGDNIAGLQTAQSNYAYQMREYAQALNLDANQSSLFSKASQDADGNFVFGDEKYSAIELREKIEDGSFAGDFSKYDQYEDVYEDQDVYEDVPIYENKERIRIGADNVAEKYTERVQTGTECRKTGTKSVKVGRKKIASGADIAMKYIQAQADSNKVAKDIADAQKKQALYQKEDSNKKN